jgi:hypothetical protein
VNNIISCPHPSKCVTSQAKKRTWTLNFGFHCLHYLLKSFLHINVDSSDILSYGRDEAQSPPLFDR